MCWVMSLQRLTNPVHVQCFPMARRCVASRAQGTASKTPRAKLQQRLLRTGVPLPFARQFEWRPSLRQDVRSHRVNRNTTRMICGIKFDQCVHVEMYKNSEEAKMQNAQARHSSQAWASLRTSWRLPFERRARDSNPQPLAGYLSSSEAAHQLAYPPLHRTSPVCRPSIRPADRIAAALGGFPDATSRVGDRGVRSRPIN